MEKMILFGSLVENKIESISFDIDIAVKSSKYYQLVSRALQSEFKVDLVDLDSAHERIKKNIIEHGRVIYEKKQD
jgi:predicted nucleotidyltransferase